MTVNQNGWTLVCQANITDQSKVPPAMAATIDASDFSGTGTCSLAFTDYAGGPATAATTDWHNTTSPSGQTTTICHGELAA